MDIVLEVVDTFLLDIVYAKLLPANSRQIFQQPVENVATTTFSSMREAPTPFRQATQLFTLEPSKYAYLSSLPRDNPWRQGLSLYLITWYVYRI